MSVKAVLDKLAEHNSDVIGCLATHGGETYSSLKASYAMVDAASVGEEAHQMFELFDALDDPRTAMDEIVMEMRDHSVFARRLDDGVLVVLNKPVERKALRRLKVGFNLFVRPLKRELAAEAAERRAAATSKRTRRIYRGIEY